MANPEQAEICVNKGWSLVALNGKIPVEKDWTNLPKTTKEEARKIAERGNFGIRTGRISDLAVLDVDVKSGGLESLATLGLPLETIPCVRTGSGGFHYYFLYPKQGLLRNSAGKLGPGLDIRADGGQVVGPTSVHPETGKEYVCEHDGVLPEFPDFLYERLTKAPTVVYNEGELIPKGQRDTFLTSIAGSMRRRGMSEAAICAALTEENKRCDPPKSETDLQRITKSIMRYEPENPVQLEQEVGVEPGAQGLIDTSDPSVSASGEGELILIPTNPSRPSLPALLSFSELREIEIPPIEVVPTPLKFLNRFLAGGFGLGELSFLIAKQASGKTSLACMLSANAVTQGYNTLVVHYEDSFRALKKRYSSLFSSVPAMSDVYFVNALQHKTGLHEIEKAIAKIKPAFVVIDYFSRIPAPSTSKGSESRFEAKHVTECLKDLAVKYDCAILVTDHVTILQTKSGNQYKIFDYMVAEAKMYKLACVDIMLGLCKDNDDPRKLYLTGMKMKREFTDDNPFYTFRVDWANCIFQE